MQCNQQLNFKDKGCVCNSGFICNDCHQNAEEINEQSETQIFLQNHAAFFYIEYLGNKMKLDFEEQSVVLPTELQNIDERMFEQYTLNTSNPLTLYFDIPQNIISNKRLIFAALPKKADQVQNDNTLIVSLTFEKEESSVETYVIVISIVIPIFISSFYCVQIKEKERNARISRKSKKRTLFSSYILNSISSN